MRIEDRLRRVLSERAASQRVRQHSWNRVQPDIARRASEVRAGRRRAVAALITGASAAALLISALVLLVVANS